ncbi:MAG: hypothetical protein R3279_04640 [Putridiphycobacter sp.]|nr:hypothetical protein [Putridiphycobacter sp.]
MKKIAFLVLVLATTFNSEAQRPDYQDLNIYFADGDYEKLLSKAEKYTQDDDCRKDALPYLYLSKANFEISKGGDQALAEEFPRAYKDAIKYASKAIQKDDEARTMYYANLGHFTALKNAVYEEIINLVAAEEYGRLLGTLPLMEKLEKDDVGTAFLKAVAKYHRGDKSGFKIEQKTAQALFDNMDTGSLVMSKDDSVEEADKKKIDREVFKFGVLQYAKLLVQIEEVSEARNVLGKIKQLYEKDENFMSEYNKIVN